MKRCWIVWAVALVAVIILWLVVGLVSARAHDHNHPELNDWYKSLYSKNNTWCCNGDDADDPEDWDIKDGHYRVLLDGQWTDVPDGAVVEGENKAGRAKIWPWHLNGFPAVRCFMPGSMS